MARRGALRSINDPRRPRTGRRKEVFMVEVPSQPLEDIDPEFQKFALETGD